MLISGSHFLLFGTVGCLLHETLFERNPRNSMRIDIKPVVPFFSIFIAE